MKMASFDVSLGRTYADWNVATDKALARQWLTDWQGTGTQTLTGNGCQVRFTATGSNSATVFTVPTVTNFVVTSDSSTTYSIPSLPPAAPVVRQPAPLSFSPYINATELVLEFLTEARARIPGLTRERFLRLTIADFFAFLIRRAAETDGVPPPEMATAEIQMPLRPLRCGWCGRFLPQAFELLRMYHCGVPCLERAALRDGIRLPGLVGA